MTTPAAVNLLTVRVASKTPQAQDICTFDLVSADGGPLPAFTAGAHVDVHVPGGPVRQYSLCSDPADAQRWRIGVLRDAASRGGSVAMHERLAAGDTLQISAPRNHFPLAAAATHSLLLAGGIGVTPILCMAQALHAAGASFRMHYCARSRERAAFVDELAAAPYAAAVRTHFDDEGAPQQLDLAALLSAADAGTHLYVCGPRGFMNAVLDAARQAGWPEDRLHYEFFSGATASPNAEGDQPFEVELQSTGRVVLVARDQTIVQALGAAGVDVMVSCEQGVCGTCLTRVCAGTPEHRDSYLTPEEQAANDQMLLCCSRAKSVRLVLQI